jgi:hypothetical protein
LGGGIGDYAETKRREMAMKMLRDQQVADRELARQQELDDLQAGYDRQDALNTQSQGMILPESMYLPGGEATMGGLGGMRMKPAVATLRDMYPQQRQQANSVPDPTTVVRIIPHGGAPTDMAVKTSGLADDVRSYGSQGYVSTGFDETGRLVLRQSAPTQDPPRPSTPSEDRLAASELQKRIAAAVEGDIGNPATLLRNQASYDAKGKKVGTSFVDIPSRGGGQFINHDDFSYFENPEAAGNAYAGSLADSLALRGITTYDQLPGGVVPMDMRQNAWSNVVNRQPTVADMDFTLPLIADMKEPGWKFDDKGTADPLDDQFVNKRQWKPDQEMPVPDFIRTMVTPKADAEGRIEFKAFDSMFKKQYGVSYSDLIKGTAPEGF